MKVVGYFCPRCKCRAAELPATCEVCTLPLVFSHHLARSYHHLFPVKPFQEIPQTAAKGKFCGGMRLALVPFTHCPPSDGYPDTFDVATAREYAGRLWCEELQLQLFHANMAAVTGKSAASGAAGVSRIRFEEELAKCPINCFSCTKVMAGFVSFLFLNNSIIQALVPHRMLRLRCPDCENVFCLDCDVFLHDNVHNCPGCLIKRQFS